MPSEGGQDAFTHERHRPTRNPVWTELRSFYLEQWVCCFEEQKMRLDSEGSWMSVAAATFFGKESVLLDPNSSRSISDAPCFRMGLSARDLDRLTKPQTSAHSLEIPPDITKSEEPGGTRRLACTIEVTCNHVDVLLHHSISNSKYV